MPSDVSAPVSNGKPGRLRRLIAARAEGEALRKGNLLVLAVLLLVAVVALLPFYWMLSSSLRMPDQMFANPVQWIPNPINWASYPEAWGAQNFGRYFFNSSVVAVLITLGNLLFCSLAAYSLTKFRFRGRHLSFMLILSTMMLPLEITMVPLFLIVNSFGWTNSYQGLVVPFLVEGFGVFLMRQYMLSIPTDVIEAARIDGASELRIFWMIVMPLCKPALVALAIFTFREAWDLYIWPLVIITDDALRTLPLGISLFMSGYGTAWDQVMAIAVLGTLPMALLFFFLQRAFIQGIAGTGLK
ncbi:carbohydrate ABC transporter permease [Pseudogemmobacter bohemicus]|uniref:carbohydrate ABC transporter permease n=1 Tax=Pseudogemmobacter bohemicus TaxID=2250708 RepID=UPI000DD3694E|nr:carbohydrate ABC transporter permease [Pseudogemmobacter bohemicus]